MDVRYKRYWFNMLDARRWPARARTVTGVAAMTLVAACASNAWNVPIRIMVEGGRGFSMQGSLKFTGDPEVTKARIQRVFDRACSAPATMTQFDMHRIGNSGLKFYQYEAVAKCQK